MTLEDDLPFPYCLRSIENFKADRQFTFDGSNCKNMGYEADPLDQHILLTAERKFWRCVESGERPRLFGIEAPAPRIEAVRVVDMTGSNSWPTSPASTGGPGVLTANTRRRNPSSRSSCPTTPGRRRGMGYGPSARNPAPSAST